MKRLTLILFLLTSSSVFGQQPDKNELDKNGQLEITKAEKQKFDVYLKGNKWKIIKLLNNPCDDEMLINASDELCLSRKGFSYGSHYSFSARVYYQKFAHIRYATLSLIKDKLIVKSSSQTAQILTDLGERKLSNPLKEIKDFAEFPLNDKLLSNLRTPNYQSVFRGLTITNNIIPTLNHGYLIRSIFTDYYQTLIAHPRETICYFQIVEKNKNSIILLWREIYSKNI